MLVRCSACFSRPRASRRCSDRCWPESPSISRAAIAVESPLRWPPACSVFLRLHVFVVLPDASSYRQRHDHRRADVWLNGQLGTNGEFRGGHARDYRGLGAEREPGGMDRRYLLRGLRGLRADPRGGDRQDRCTLGVRWLLAARSLGELRLCRDRTRFLDGARVALPERRRARRSPYAGFEAFGGPHRGPSRSARHRDLYLVLRPRQRRLVLSHWG